MIRSVLVFAFACIALGAKAQSNYEQFKTLLEKNDTLKMRSLLTAWESSNPDDPELYVSAFNYYFKKSIRQMIALQKEEPQSGEGYSLKDSTGDIAGYMTSEKWFDEAMMDSGLTYIDKGIEKFPDRLDMRFGKCFVLGQAGDYGKMTREIVAVVDRSLENKNNWYWMEGKKQEHAQGFMLTSIYDYMKQLYDLDDDRMLMYMQQIGDKVLRYYSNEVEILSLTGVAYLLTRDFDEAIEYFKQAEKIDPEDFIVLNNIAQAYRMKKDNTNAIKYYELTAKYGDEEAKETAIANINELKKTCCK